MQLSSVAEDGGELSTVNVIKNGLKASVYGEVVDKWLPTAHMKQLDQEYDIEIGLTKIEVGKAILREPGLKHNAGSNVSRSGLQQQWACRVKSRRANGATQTFRRSSNAPTTANSAHQRDGSSSQPRTSIDSPGVYIPPHISASRNGTASEHRYSKELLLQHYKIHSELEGSGHVPSSLFIGDWESNITNGSSSASWGRRDEPKDTHGADLCWDRYAQTIPLGLTELTEEEKEIFCGSVNSPNPTKAPATTNKDGTPKEVGSHRKISISQSINSPGGYGLTSPTSARPRNARRETSEAYPFPSSPSANSRFSRDDSSAATPPPSLIRRRTDMKDSQSGSGTEERDKERSGNTDALPLAGLKRNVTGGLGSASPSTWSSNSGTAFGAMGSFALGSFAPGASSGQSGIATDKRPGFGSIRGESRFKTLMSKGSSEDVRRDTKEKASIGNPGKGQGTDHDKGNSSWMEARFNRPTSEDTDPFPEDLPTGSAALNGALDAGPPQQRGFSGFASQGGNDDFSAFGMTSDTIGDAIHQTPHRNHGGPEQMSPTDTNPYQSPENDSTARQDGEDSDGSDIQPTRLLNLGGFGSNQNTLPGLGTLGGGLGRHPGSFEIAASDRSQTSSVGPAGRGFPSLNGLGGLPGLGGPSTWGAGQGAIGTPTRERSGFGGAFGDALYGSMAELQSPVLAGLGSGGSFGAAPGSGLSSGIGRGSKLGSLFSPGMQEQMRSSETGRQGSEELPFDSFDRQHPGFGGSFGRNTFGQNALSARENDNPFRTGRGVFEDMMVNATRNEGQTPIGEPISHGQFSGNGATPSLSTQASQEPLGIHRNTTQPPLHRQPSVVGASPGAGNPPVSQVRQMVMPDRMRWIYKDPNNNTQGPWSGLEMHDWYKNGYFTPELLIKKVEDPEFEPLAQLIRRIGNSREPFLVPQIGIPHELPPQSRGAQGPTAPGAQPPFASSFPSFGTTLTAEQQNALERRKQEEQFLMARQKEHLAQQQLLLKQIHVGGPSHGGLPQLNHQGSGHLPQLSHQTSGHSLHSKPSFGSVTSPSGYQPSPTVGPLMGGQSVPASGFFDNSFRSAPGAGIGPIGSSGEMLGNIREDDYSGMMERLNLRGKGQQGPVGYGQNQTHEAHAQQVQTMLNDRARLEREQAEHDAHHQGFGQDQIDGHQAADRFQRFRNLRAQAEHELQQSGPSREEREQGVESAVKSQIEQSQRDQGRAADVTSSAEPQSLTQQVQAAASAKQAVAQQTPWTKMDISNNEPVQRPPQSSSPMPAPVAQRKQNLVETLAEESRSRTQSPSVETPSASIAPWAKEPAEAPKAQSLKEIQEAEAKRAAKNEELAAAHRRAVYERELAAAQAAAINAPAPGLPPGASWASAQSPAPGATASGPSVWGAKTPSKPSSKTLAQIQREEENKKQRAAAAAAVNASISAAMNTPQSSSGKRYADLAGKTASPASAVGGSAWSTVGAGGKVKSMPPAPGSPAVRAISGSIPTAPAKPLMTSRSSTLTSAQMSKMSKADALDEFKKWASSELMRGELSKEVSAPTFVEGLLSLGSDVEIITEAVHHEAKTLDSRHFAEEFVRRKKQADKGIVEPLGAASPVNKQATSNEWSAVAKKGQAPPVVAEPAFKMAKTKGRRK
ncbi:hypothetical protein FKW77_008166 [Venturia effusa]|uniref:GYF domain-containing protein n=1 Tax=Venturia effusa TaxID=50376 RepID=A0A517L5X3_9PEZI|nr:hypothetical protein FKW77_008166 [Venturia effusa]